MSGLTRTTRLEAPEGDERRVVVDGDVIVDGDVDANRPSWVPPRLVAYAVRTSELEADNWAEAVVRGSARVTAEDMSAGVGCYAFRNGQRARAVVEGDVSAEGARVWGIDQNALDSNNDYEQSPFSEVIVGGDIEVRSRCDHARGIYAHTDGITNCIVQGNVIVSNENKVDEVWDRTRKANLVEDFWDERLEEYGNGRAHGIQVESWGQATVGVGGDVRVAASCLERDGYAWGIEIGSFYKSTRVVVGGTIVAHADGEAADDCGGIAVGIDVWRHDGGDVFVSVGGVVAEGPDQDTTGIMIESSSEEDRPVRVEVHVLGDVTSSGNGISVTSYRKSDAEPSLCVLVDGTVRAGGNGVCVGRRDVRRYDPIIDADMRFCEGEPWGDVDITVWRIDVGENRRAVQADEGVEGAVSYIVRVEQPEEGASIRILSDLGKKAFRDVPRTYDVAHAGEVVRFAVDVREGYQLAAVYGIQGEGALAPEADGTYQVRVPSEGGVLLRAVCEG